ncbi:unnamed protein product [Rotaria magnacalcarata]|uniref:Xaa-Pro aminopeptidase n=5 Tax=Rotaria magnacalcarata TaxID=392030 RepID=A0A816EYN8_9BILA|nr:unnamed protein product [Rotaria magnacalcarata]CAF1655433.1 unnamed protein product [Rotaria magnacalcarata]CAF2026432.1 unnamed protein product [Rotaria magnacalcarata]CAF3958896.1 unnamed protein product [Rotaria magnacalcarata]CAF3966520.1 unnamed protein product [Rotaria magnacalcarata]
MLISSTVIGFILFINNVRFVVCQGTNFNCAVKPTQADTTDRLQRLRAHLKSNNLSAYVIFSEDEHQSEYVQLYDERRAWITGFLGSAGTAVVTLDSAALWTDGRYWTQAEDELDCRNWYLMRQGREGVPSLSNWLSSQVNSTPPYNHVGVAAQFVSSDWWQAVNNILNGKNASLVEVRELIDLIWSSPERPLAVANPINIHEFKYTGISWEDKVKAIAERLKVKHANAYVVTALDEVAWLFSLRGSDIPYNPFFKAYAIVNADQTTQLWLNRSQLTSAASNQLSKVNIHPYGSFLSDLNQLANQNDISQIWISSSASQAIFNRIPKEKLLIASSPVELTKALKNPTEEKGMRDCGIRDGVARVRHLIWLENQLNNNIIVNETKSAEQLELFQSEEALFQMLSFDSISAFGANAAIIHYSPKAQTAATITKNGLYLLDAGAQYLDCTTDVTRTHVFGTATEEQKNAYTLVLQGSIDLADAVFPYGTYGRSLDILTRQSLYRNSMDYNHGTGHGIGHFLSVHEGPSFISMGYSSSDIPLTDGMVFSDEPGFYLPGNFGIRLETDIVVKNYTLPNNYVNSATQFLHFEILTMVPFERNLIICKMLTEAQKDWLNWYHREVKSKLESTKRLNQDELRYLAEKTQEIKC